MRFFIASLALVVVALVAPGVLSSPAPKTVYVVGRALPRIRYWNVV